MSAKSVVECKFLPQPTEPERIEVILDPLQVVVAELWREYFTEAYRAGFGHEGACEYADLMTR